MNVYRATVLEGIQLHFKRWYRWNLDTKATSYWRLPTGHKTDIVVYNRLVREKVPLILKNKGVINWYICGPTVYDSSHIGHACCYMKFDIIRRILETYFGLTVVQVMCITNVDDKIIRRSAEMKKDWQSFAKDYEVEFFKDITSLDIVLPDIVVRVSDYILEMIHFVQVLLDKGYAYKSSDSSVYFDTGKYGKYGKLAKVVENMEQNEEVSSYKKSSLDFVLWKSAQPNEPYWDASFGPGRPGWHLECSTFASHFFGSEIDIHSGGIDLMYPHHENEEAQSCAYHDTDQWVNYWLHNGHLRLGNNVKMSKSLKNAISIQDFLKTFTTNHLRMLCLMSDYKNCIEYSDCYIDDAILMCNRFRAFFEMCKAHMDGKAKGDVDEPILLQHLEETKVKIRSLLADDFNTSEAIQTLLSLMTTVNVMLLESANVQHASSPTIIVAIASYIRSVLNIFGIRFHEMKGIDGSASVDTYSMVDAAASFRENVRRAALDGVESENNDVAKMSKEVLKYCDDLRREFHVLGVSLKDRKKNSSWSFLEKRKKTEENNTE